MLEQWQELAFNKDTYDVAYYNEYVGTLNIHLLDMNILLTFGFFHLYLVLSIDKIVLKSCVWTKHRDYKN